MVYSPDQREPRSEVERLRAEILALSDERAQWQAYALDLARDAYRNGYRDGQADEAQRANDAFAAERPRPPVADGPTLAELAEYRASHGRLCRCVEHRAEQ